MVKHKVAWAMSAVTLMTGVGSLSPAGAFAEAAAERAVPFCVEGGSCYDTLQKAFDAVPNDGSLTVVYLDSTDDVVKDGGAKTKDGQNITFDLRGKTYDISQNTVGSTGTETNAFQLLKGSTFTLKNGSVVGTSSNAKIWLQNYATTTLENVILDATNYGQTQYVVSNNFGSLTVKGNTQIIANANGVAFDLWYGLSSKGLYDDGLTVTFGDDFTGKVVGKIEYGSQARAKDFEDWRDKTVLNISNGTFETTFVSSSTDALKGANINISGGTFSSQFDSAYLAEGMSAYSKDNVWVVDKNATLPELPATISIEKGETYTIEMSEIVKKYANISFMAENGSATIDRDNLVITGEKAGDAGLTISLIQMGKGGDSKTSTVLVYELGNEAAEVYAKIDQAKVDETSIDSGVVSKIAEKIGEKKLAGYYEIDVNVYKKDDSNPAGSISETDMLMIVLDVPEGLPEVADGYVRKYYVVRYHGDAVDMLDAEEKDGTIVFYNDKFSTFALIYEDVEGVAEAATPDTGIATIDSGTSKVDTSALIITVAAMTIATVMMEIVLWKKRQSRKD